MAVNSSIGPFIALTAAGGGGGGGETLAFTPPAQNTCTASIGGGPGSCDNTDSGLSVLVGTTGGNIGSGVNYAYDPDTGNLCTWGYDASGNVSYTGTNCCIGDTCYDSSNNPIAGTYAPNYCV